MLSFLTVTASIIILVYFALGIELIVFLERYKIILSLILWAFILWIAIHNARKTNDASEKSLILSMPFCFLPAYAFLIAAITETVQTRTGLYALSACIEIPMCFCFTLGVGIGIGMLCHNIKEPVLAGSLTVLGSLLFMFWVLSI